MKKKIICFFIAILFLLNTSVVFAHPGRTDSYGGHYCRKGGWGYTVGKYHYHSGKYAGYEVSYKGQIPAQFKTKKIVKPKKIIKKATKTKKQIKKVN